jgi:ATP-dependent Lhr-like helicase
MDAGAPTILPPAFAGWFASRGWAPREHQLAMVEKGGQGRDALLIAPTGGGKTLAGFLPSLIELAERPPANAPRGVHTLYISPLKALAVDIERNLAAPIAEMGLAIKAESRTGDTGIARRQRQRVKPPDILLTTPEQLALFLAWEGARLYFEDLKCVILDEIHAIRPSKRGDLLSLGLARLAKFAPDCRRVGLSATVNDPDLIRAWMAKSGSDEVDLVLGQGGAPPVVDMLLVEGQVPWTGHTARHAMAEVYDAIRRAKTALVFVNTRFQAEFAFQELWRLNDEGLPIALHHGSLSAEQRRRVEAAMARGQLRAVVCTSTLDLGIDWGDVDLVIQLASPKGAARMVQRIGRANHRLDEPSRALFVPANRFEMLECQAAREAIAENALDKEIVRAGALDVLAQHIMGLACSEPFDLVELYDEVRSAEPYRDLSWEDFEAVVDFVATGGYALRVYDRFARIVKGLDALWRARNAETILRHRLNVGAIYSPAMLAVRMAGRRGTAGRKIGEVEEGYLEVLEPGDAFIFAGRTWRLVGVTGVDVLVAPAEGQEAKMPSWGGSKFALSTFLARRVRKMMSDPTHWSVLPFDVREWLELQRDHSSIPATDEMLLESFQHGARHFLVGYPFEGRLAHTTLCMLLTRRLARAGAGPLGFVANDYAFAVWALKPMDELDMADLFAEDMLGDDLESWLADSAMMRGCFKACALISGLIERRFPGDQKKSGRQISFSTDLVYDVLRRHQPDHLLLRCAREDAAHGLIDAARLGDLLKRVKGGILHRKLPHLSPFSVSVMMEIGKQPSPGDARDEILAASAADLVAEALA